MTKVNETDTDATLKIGWAEVEITPVQPVQIAGQFYTRISEGVRTPLVVTAWAMESGEEHAVFVSCDVATISHDLLDTVRTRLHGASEGLVPLQVVLHATHTHTGPVVRFPASSVFKGSGVDLGPEVMSIEAYVDYAADRIVQAVVQAWTQRVPSGIGFGQGFAVIGRNRRWVDVEGNTTMYNLKATNAHRFRHMEGYEDHSVNLLATYDSQGKLTGLVVNLTCPAQEGEHEFSISADFWHETREEIRRRWGSDLFVLPQCSAAGDISPHLMFDQKAQARMQTLTERTVYEEIAQRIASAIDEVLPYISQAIDPTPLLRHQVDTVELPMNKLTKADADTARTEAEAWRVKYEEEKRKLGEQPELREEPRWYKEVSTAFRRMHWHLNVIQRFEEQQSKATLSAELHTLRLGEVVFATNPFEYYLDFGIQIKLRSSATQTFLVQLAGNGTYVPSQRSVAGGGYGSVPASKPVGPEGGQQIAERTVHVIRSLWDQTGNDLEE